MFKAHVFETRASSEKRSAPSNIPHDRVESTCPAIIIPLARCFFSEPWLLLVNIPAAEIFFLLILFCFCKFLKHLAASKITTIPWMKQGGFHGTFRNYFVVFCKANNGDFRRIQHISNAECILSMCGKPLKILTLKKVLSTYILFILIDLSTFLPVYRLKMSEVLIWLHRKEEKFSF